MPFSFQKSQLLISEIVLYFCSIKKPVVPVVQWIECQIPVLMMGVRIPSGTLQFKQAAYSLRAVFLFSIYSNKYSYFNYFNPIMQSVQY